MAIHIWDIMVDTVVKTVRSVTKIGENSSISLPMSGLSQTFKKNNLPTFTSTKRETVKDESRSFEG